MLKLVQSRITLIWSFLILATCVSWQSVHGLAFDRKALTAGIIVIAFIKVRYVVLDFMEVRTAPMLLRAVCEAWIILVCASIISVYWIG